MRLRAVLPAPFVWVVTLLATSAVAQKARPAAPPAAPASLPGQADLENAANQTRAWMEHVVGGILDGSTVDERPARPPKRER